MKPLYFIVHACLVTNGLYPIKGCNIIAVTNDKQEARKFVKNGQNDQHLAKTISRHHGDSELNIYKIDVHDDSASHFWGVVTDEELGLSRDEKQLINDYIGNDLYVVGLRSLTKIEDIIQLIQINTRYNNEAMKQRREMCCVSE